MAIQWYPGHMHKTRQAMKKALPQMDLVIEVIDARIPFSSANPLLNEMRGDKPVIKVFNKADLADPGLTEQWQDYLSTNQSLRTLPLTASEPREPLKLLNLCRQMVSFTPRPERRIQAMILGIPNVGKSTLINTLSGRAIAKTGNEPAVTKMLQRIRIADDMVLHDTPGMLWPNLDNPGTGYRLAVTGAIRETAVDNLDIASYAVEYLMQAYPERLKARFQVDQLADDDWQMLEMMALGRGCVMSGGRPDMQRISKLLLTELRRGDLGPITLETPAMMETELVELEQIRADRAAKKAARKQKSKN